MGRTCEQALRIGLPAIVFTEHLDFEDAWRADDGDLGEHAGSLVDSDGYMRLPPFVAQVHADAPPFHIAHGTADEHVPFAQSEALAAALTDAGAAVGFLPVAGGKHFWLGMDDTAPLFDAALAFTSRVTAH